LLVERIETQEQEVIRVVWTPPARPFFATAASESERAGEGEAAPVWRPRTVLGERASHRDPLAWYAAQCA
jgi:hypothetical protein